MCEKDSLATEMKLCKIAIERRKEKRSCTDTSHNLRSAGELRVQDTSRLRTLMR